MVRTALLLIGLVLLAHGAEGTWRAVRSRAQAQTTCADFAAAKPASAWVRLTGCEVDYVHAGYRETAQDLWGRLFDRAEPRGRITELLFPIRTAGADASAPAALVVSTRDPQVLAIAERTLGASGDIDQEAFLVLMLQVVTAMRASREIDGTIRAPLDTLRSRAALGAIRAPLAGDYAVLDLHARPRVILPAVELGAGVVAFGVVLLRRRRRTPAPARPPEGGSHIPRLMLLNLPPSAEPKDLEDAPPLGTQADVRARIAAILPSIVFDDTGKGRVADADHSVEIDLGRGDPVYTAVVELKGNALPLLAALLEKTGWRAYAPKRGAFVNTD